MDCKKLYFIVLIFFICSINAFGRFFKSNTQILNNNQPVFIYEKWHGSLFGQTCSLSRNQVEKMHYSFNSICFCINILGFMSLKSANLSASGVIKGFGLLVAANVLLAYDRYMFFQQADPWLKALQDKEALLKASQTSDNSARAGAPSDPLINNGSAHN